MKQWKNIQQPVGLGNRVFYSMIMFLFFLTALAGGAEIDKKESVLKNNIYAEFGGHLLLGSIYYERMLSPKNSIRIGGLPGLGLTISHNMLFGKPPLFFELGTGLKASRSLFGILFHDGHSDDNENHYQLAIDIGLRYQHKKGFIARLCLTPFITGNFIPWVGLSIGWSFR